MDGVDDEPGEPFFDELPADDWAAELGDRWVCWLAELWSDRADQLERTCNFAVDGGDLPA